MSAGFVSAKKYTYNDRWVYQMSNELDVNFYAQIENTYIITANEFSASFVNVINSIKINRSSVDYRLN